jgi:hypothetical protein
VIDVLNFAFWPDMKILDQVQFQRDMEKLSCFKSDVCVQLATEWVQKGI